MMRRTRVFGPAYLDRVLRVDRPLLRPDLGGPIDQGVDGILARGRPGLTLVDPAGGVLDVGLPAGWPGPTGTIYLSRALSPARTPWRRRVGGESWRDDLGGMGAGYAEALGGVLTCPLGPEDDPTSRAISGLLEGRRIEHRPVRVAGRSADWTLLLTSGPFGDKLPIGFRGCVANLPAFDLRGEGPCDLLVVASMTNRLASEALRIPASARFFAPSIRNMLDRSPPLARSAGLIDALACNRREWGALPAQDRDVVTALVPILALTDGPSGSVVSVRRPDGSRSEHAEPAFPRSSPPVDTNRAGEAYASTLLSALLDEGGVRVEVDEATLRAAALRASAAASLVLDRAEFGFPTAAEIDAALHVGFVGPRA